MTKYPATKDAFFVTLEFNSFEFMPLEDKAFLGQQMHHPLSPFMAGKRVAKGEKRDGVELLVEEDKEQDPAVHLILFILQLLFLVHFRSIRRTKYLSRMFIHT